MIPTTPWRPSKLQLEQARDQAVPDLIREGLKVLFCGINPSLYSAAVGHHFARPGNRFWPVLHGAGFTRELIGPFAETVLLDAGYGVTNVVDRATARADELSREELAEGGRKLVAKVERYKPRIVAFLGVGAYRSAFERPRAQVGAQVETLGRSRLWILPNPSGLNAHYQKADLITLFHELIIAVDAT